MNEVASEADLLELTTMGNQGCLQSLEHYTVIHASMDTVAELHHQPQAAQV